MGHSIEHFKNCTPENSTLLKALLQWRGIILLILSVLTVSNLFGQDKLRDYLVKDSLIRKYNIKQVTENWFFDSLQISPANTTIEKYNEFGQKIQRIQINYFYDKFLDNYIYDQKKKLIIKKQTYYDWNPFRERRKGDTIVKKNVSKYDINSGRNLKSKSSALDKFQPRLIFDNYGRISGRIDTIKCGYETTYYSFDTNGKVIEKTHYTSQHNEKPNLFAIDSLHYNLNGQLVKKTNYYGIKMKEDGWEFNREVITTYNYSGDLIIEKTNVTKYHSLTNREFKPTVYRYEYEFY